MAAERSAPPPLPAPPPFPPSSLPNHPQPSQLPPQITLPSPGLRQPPPRNEHNQKGKPRAPQSAVNSLKNNSPVARALPPSRLLRPSTHRQKHRVREVGGPVRCVTSWVREEWSRDARLRQRPGREEQLTERRNGDKNDGKVETESHFPNQ